MSVPPPSCVPKSTSTGSSSWSVRSTTAVSKTTSRVEIVRIEASTAPNTDAYTTDAAMDPDWSIQRMTSFFVDWDARPNPMSRSGTIVRYSGR